MVPSSDTISGYTTFSPNGLIKSAEINANFAIWRGHVIPVDPSVTAAVSGSYDLGSSSYRWRYVYGKPVSQIVSTTGSYSASITQDVALLNANAATITVSLPTAVGNTGRCLSFKKTDSSANNIVLDGNSSETIDGTVTSSITVQFEAVTLISDGSNWHII